MTVTLHLVSVDHAEELLDFENRNRAFFESVIAPRHKSYYQLANLQKILHETEEDHVHGRCYMYLIRDISNTLVGRINVTSIIRGIQDKADIGYRIGKAFSRKGYATAAVKQVCALAFEQHHLHRLEAGTAPDNIGSQIVLIKNGFQFVGRARQSHKLHGQWVDSVLFEKINE